MSLRFSFFVCVCVCLCAPCSLTGPLFGVFLSLLESDATIANDLTFSSAGVPDEEG